jgi:multiple sugar transport system ATP-binding protein
MATLELCGIHKHYGAVHAVKGIDLAVATGEFTVLVGPSGCGKSTLLRAIAGLEAIDEGSIRIAGEDVTHARPRDRDLAMVFQSYALYPYLTVRDNIAFGLRARRMPKAEIAARVARAAEMLAIAPLLERYPRELSGGQRQRVAIGRAIVRDARIYLFDEPLSNLDAKLRDGMREEIKRLHREIGRTFLYVTHDQIEAMTLADRIVLLNDGRIEQQGAPLDLFERPVNRFVAGFLGSPSMNFLPARVEAGMLHLGDGQRLALTPAQAEAAGTRDVVWGVRPEHFRAGAVDGQAIAARLEIVQPTGSRVLGSFTLAGQRVTCEIEAHRAEAGTPLRLGVAIERTILLDPASGRTIYPRPDHG